MKELLEKFGKNNLEKAAVEPFILKNTLWGVKKIVDDALNDVKDILGIVVGLDNNKKGTDKVQVAGMKDLTGKLKDKLEKLENKMNEIGDTIETGINEGRQKLEDWAENKQKELEDLAEDVKNKYEELKKNMKDGVNKW